jgi:SAM-dependent methyltransferase
LDLVHRVVDAVMPPIAPGQRLSVLDPACGDGRFLAAAADHVAAAGGHAQLYGVDVDAAAAETARRVLAGRGDVEVVIGDALTRDWGDEAYDVVLANPPYLNQLAAATTRGGASRRGGGPYADVAAEFLDLAVALARPGGGRIGVLLPQSILGSRDAGPVRARVEQLAEPIWSWWSPRRQFDAAVFVCAVGFERREVGPPEPDASERAPASERPEAACVAGERNFGNPASTSDDPEPVWTTVVTRAMGVPDLPALTSAGCVGDHATITANFRDEYYGLIPAVGDHSAGPRLVTSGAIDPDRCSWGERPVTFNRRRFERPRVDVSRLDDKMQRWARRLAVPKALIANQTRVLECVVDRDGTMLPSVPVITARPNVPGDLELSALGAVLSSPLVSAWLWHHAAGTGLSARTIRISPAVLAAAPWPAGALTAAVAAYEVGDLAGSAVAVHDAYGIDAIDGERLLRWWTAWVADRA